MGKMNFEQISMGPQLIKEADLVDIIPLLRDHYQIKTPTEENITTEVV